MVSVPFEIPLSNGLPPLSYACLIALTLANSRIGLLRVSEIYNFFAEHFPYFEIASIDWKHSIRRNLWWNEWFDKIEHKTTGNNSRTKYLWTLNASKIDEIDARVQTQVCVDLTGIHNVMAMPENLAALLRGDMKHGSLNDSYANLDDTGNSESQHENGPIDSIIDSDENIEVEFLDVAFDVDDIELFELAQCAKDSHQTEFLHSDLHPIQKRARLNIACPVAPARTLNLVTQLMYSC